MKRKIAALTLAVCVGTLALAGCGGSGSGAGNTTAAGTEAATEAEAGADEKAEAAGTDEKAEAGEEAGSGENADASAEQAADAGKDEAAGDAGASSDLDKLVFTYVTAPLNVPTIIERDQGIFAKTFGEMGIDAEYAELTSGADQTQALASGDVQVLYAVGSSSVILSAANGADIKVLNMYSRSPKAFCLYSSDESLTTPESLRGKTIAGPVGTNLHELLAAYLKTAGMSVEDVNLVNMGIPDSLAGLEGGSVDVAMLAGATAYQAEQEGLHLITDGEGLIPAIIAVAVRDDFYQAHPEIIEKLAEAQEEIVRFMEEKPEETTQIVAEALDLEPEAVNDMAQYYDFSLETSDEDVAGFQKTADFMLEAEMIEEAVDVKDLFY